MRPWCSQSNTNSLDGTFISFVENEKQSECSKTHKLFARLFVSTTTSFFLEKTKIFRNVSQRKLQKEIMCPRLLCSRAASGLATADQSTTSTVEVAAGLSGCQSVSACRDQGIPTPGHTNLSSRWIPCFPIQAMTSGVCAAIDRAPRRRWHRSLQYFPRDADKLRVRGHVDGKAFFARWSWSTEWHDSFHHFTPTANESSPKSRGVVKECESRSASVEEDFSLTSRTSINRYTSELTGHLGRQARSEATSFCTLGRRKRVS